MCNVLNEVQKACVQVSGSTSNVVLGGSNEQCVQASGQALCAVMGVMGGQNVFVFAITPCVLPWLG